MTLTAHGEGWEVRHGRWQDVLQDVQPDCVITDVPYGERVIKGQRSGSVGYAGDPRQNIPYAFLPEEEAREFASNMLMRARRWGVTFCDHTQWYLLESVVRPDWMTFQPIPWVKSCGGTPRFAADGPAASSEWMFVSRPRKREFLVTRYRRGHYSFPAVRGQHNYGVTGAKNLDLMRAVVRDYSEPGDLICDPFSGSGTTLLAAVLEGRRAIGAEADLARFYAAVSRVSSPPPTFPGDAL